MYADKKALWVAALRSGKYTQGRSKLHFKNTDGQSFFCCLGVLCDLAVEAGAIPQPEVQSTSDGSHTTYRYAGISNVLPREVATWAGIRERNANVEVRTDELGVAEDARGRTTLTSLNDTERFTFEQIADVIEEAL